MQSRLDSLPCTKAALQCASKHPLAQLFDFAQLCTPVLPGVEGLCKALVPDSVGNGPAGLLSAMELQPGLPSGGHCLMLQSA